MSKKPNGARAQPPAAAADELTSGPSNDDVPRLVADLVLAGLGKAQVRAFLVAELQLRPGAAELDDLIENAKDDIAAQADHYRSIATELTVVRLNDLYTRALKSQDLKTALDVQRAIVQFLIGKQTAAKTAEKAPPTDDELAPPKLAGSYSDAMEKQRRRRA